VVCVVHDQKHGDLFGVHHLNDVELVGVHDGQKCVVVFGAHHQYDDDTALVFCDHYPEQ